MLAQDALDQPAQIRAHILSQRPINRHIIAHSPHQFAGNGAKRLIAQNLNRTIIGLKRVVKSQFILSHTKALTPRLNLAHVLPQLNQLINNIRRLNGAILVAMNRLLQHIGERPRLHHILPHATGNLALEQLLKQLHSEIALRHTPHLIQKLVRQYRDIRLVQTRRGKNIRHLVGRHRTRDNLTHREIQFLLRPGIGWRTLAQHRPHSLKESHIIADTPCFFVRHGQCKSLR